MAVVEWEKWETRNQSLRSLFIMYMEYMNMGKTRMTLTKLEHEQLELCVKI